MPLGIIHVMLIFDVADDRSDDGTALFAGEYGKALHRFTAPRSAEKL